MKKKKNILMISFLTMVAIVCLLFFFYHSINQEKTPPTLTNAHPKQSTDTKTYAKETSETTQTTSTNSSEEPSVDDFSQSIEVSDCFTGTLTTDTASFLIPEVKGQKNDK